MENVPLSASRKVIEMSHHGSCALVLGPPSLARHTTATRVRGQGGRHDRGAQEQRSSISRRGGSGVYLGVGRLQSNLGVASFVALLPTPARYDGGRHHCYLLPSFRSYFAVRSTAPLALLTRCRASRYASERGRWLCRVMCCCQSIPRTPLRCPLLDPPNEGRRFHP